MIPNRDLLRLRMACRPVLGLLIRGRPVAIPVPVAYVLREPRLGVYVADPWADDRRRMYSARIIEAYRFPRADLAERVAGDIGGHFTIVAVPIGGP